MTFPAVDPVDVSVSVPGVPSRGATLGIDIGGTRLRVALVSAGGAVLAKRDCSTPAQPDEILGKVTALVEVVLLGRERREIVVGICAPGPLDAPAGHALATPTIEGFRDFPLRDRIADELGLPASLFHDGQAAAFAEWRFGAGKGSGNMLFVTVSTGIGGGAVVDGRLLAGRRGMASHVGHMTVLPDGPRCACGNRGCWEALASGPALAAAARLSGFPDGATAILAARAGDRAALSLIAEQSRWLGLGLANLLHVYSPEIVVLGGGVMAGFDLMLPEIAAEVRQRAMAPFRDVPIVRGQLEDSAGVIGAAALAREGMTQGRCGDVS